MPEPTTSISTAVLPQAVLSAALSRPETPGAGTESNVGAAGPGTQQELKGCPLMYRVNPQSTDTVTLSEALRAE